MTTQTESGGLIGFFILFHFRCVRIDMNKIRISGQETGGPFIGVMLHSATRSFCDFKVIFTRNFFS